MNSLKYGWCLHSCLFLFDNSVWLVPICIILRSMAWYSTAKLVTPSILTKNQVGSFNLENVEHTTIAYQVMVATTLLYGSSFYPNRGYGVSVR